MFCLNYINLSYVTLVKKPGVQDSLRILPIEDLTDEIRIVGAFDVNATNDMLDVFLHLLKEEAASRNLAADPKAVRFPFTGQEVSAENSDRLHSE